MCTFLKKKGYIIKEVKVSPYCIGMPVFKYKYTDHIAYKKAQPEEDISVDSYYSVSNTFEREMKKILLSLN